MKDNGICPNRTTFNAVITACGKGSRPDDAINYLNDMISCQIEPDAQTYHRVVLALVRAGSMDKASEIYGGAVSAGIIKLWKRPGVADLHTHNAVSGVVGAKFALRHHAEENPTRNLEIVTGWGKRSGEDGPLLKPEIENMLKAAGINYEIT